MSYALDLPPLNNPALGSLLHPDNEGKEVWCSWNISRPSVAVIGKVQSKRILVHGPQPRFFTVDGADPTIAHRTSGGYTEAVFTEGHRVSRVRHSRLSVLLNRVNWFTVPVAVLEEVAAVLDAHGIE